MISCRPKKALENQRGFRRTRTRPIQLDLEIGLASKRRLFPKGFGECSSRREKASFIVHLDLF